MLFTKNADDVLKVLSPLEKEGLIKKLYSCDRFSLYNIANYNYAVVPYKESINAQIPMGVVLPGHTAQDLMEYGDDYFDVLLRGWINLGKINQFAFDFSDKVIDVIRKEKERTNVSGPDSRIDLSFDEMLLQNQKHR